VKKQPKELFFISLLIERDTWIANTWIANTWIAYAWIAYAWIAEAWVTEAWVKSPIKRTAPNSSSYASS
jgi:hypothetical protein